MRIKDAQYKDLDKENKSKNRRKQNQNAKLIYPGYDKKLNKNTIL